MHKDRSKAVFGASPHHYISHKKHRSYFTRFSISDFDFSILDIDVTI
jgi:hypothetical protein